jgi:hypothetical protein
VSLDVKAVVQFFGGQAELCRRLAAHGTPIPLKTIEQWVTRKSIPTDRLVTLVQLAKSEGRLFEISDFIKQEKTNENSGGNSERHSPA